MTIIVGATYSLFTDRFSVGNHLVAGELEISLQRTRLAYKSLDDAGYLSEITNTTVHDFTDRTSNNIFGLESGNIRIAPGSYFEADLRVINDNAENAPYYAVLRFEANNPIQFNQQVSLQQRAYTNVAKIRPLSDFVGFK